MTPAGSTQSYVLSMRNGLPYLSRALFWLAMEDISKRAELIKGHSWKELKEMFENHRQEPHPQVYSVKAVKVADPPEVVFTTVPRTQHFVPREVRKRIMARFDCLKVTPNANRSRLSNAALSLTFGAQTGEDLIAVVSANPRTCVPRVDFDGSRVGAECCRSCFAVSRDPNPETGDRTGAEST